MGRYRRLLRLRKRNNKLLIFYCLLLIIVASVLPASGFSANHKPGRVGILISREILPYMRMVQGLEENLERPSTRIFLDKTGKPYNQENHLRELKSSDFGVMVAVGPQALSYLHDHHWPGTVLYAMVLNPERFFWESAKVCGISLNLSPWKQLLAVTRIFPKIKRLGILFNPEKNLKWFKQAKAIMTLKRLSLVPLEVNQRSDIPKLFTPPGPQVDAILFIPDQTVISRSIISYVIKESLRLGIATFGFNRFFHESGAALSFIIDYHKIGQDMAQMVKTQANGESCVSTGPPFSALLNQKAIKTLEISIPQRLPEGVLIE